MKAFEPAGMSFSDFHNGLRLLQGIDKHELVEAGLINISQREWEDFRNEPHKFFIKASDDMAAKIWTAMEKRMRS
jgi:Mn-dependent DtxR family transcriptional regulator